MSRNAESRFSLLPEVDIQRSSFNRPSSHKTTFNAGDLIPIFADEVLPGDTFTMDTKSLVRMTTPIFPTMDSAYLDTYYFFVPNRLVWDHWKEFNGENSSGYWAQTIDYQVPQMKVNSTQGAPWGDGGVLKGDLMDYFGIPTDVPDIEFMHLPVRAYVLIWNEFFRDQNTMSPANFYKGDQYTTFMSWSEVIARDNGQTSEFDLKLLNAINGSCCLPVSKFHDYFTSTLPQPQKGEAVDLPLYQDNIPVFTGEARIDSPTRTPMYFSSSGYQTGAAVLGVVPTGYQDEFKLVGDDSIVNSLSSSSAGLSPNNLYADVSNVAVATISQLRQAFQIQRLFEKDARGGKKSLCLHVKKIAEKIWKALFYWLIRGEGFNQPQRIGNEIIFPRGRDTFTVKRYANLY